MRIAGLQKLTLLDYPDHTAATVFVCGCNMRCPFCHNSELVCGTSKNELMDEDEFFAFLEKRVGLLDGVCISGGEPTLQPDLAGFCERIREMGFAIKLDTNASQPGVLENLLDEGLLDYIAIDAKNAKSRYPETTGCSKNYFDDMFKCVNMLMERGIPFELRTTVTRELTKESDLVNLACAIPDSCTWYIQNFRDAQSVLAGQGVLHPWETRELEALLPRLQQSVFRTRLRGV